MEELKHLNNLANNCKIFLREKQAREMICLHGLWNIEKAIKSFKELGFPLKILKIGVYVIRKYLHNNYVFSNDIQINPKLDISKIFHCDINNFESCFSSYNGRYLYENQISLRSLIMEL